LFGAAAFAGFGFSPTLKAVESLVAATEDSFTCDINETRIAFKIRGHDRWVIDTRAFGGHPRLRSARSAGYLRLELAGAMFPGTRLPADFICELRRGVLSWRMSLRFSLGAFYGTARFERWLMGSETISSPIQLDHHPVCRLGLEGQLTLSGTATAQFTPDWRFVMRGPGLARFEGYCADLTSDVMRLALLNPEDPSLVRRPARARTLLAIQRDALSWEYQPAFLSHEHGRLVWPVNAFRVLHLETWEEPTGLAVGAMLLEAGEEDPLIWFHPNQPVPDHHDEPFSLPLVGTRYARIVHAAEGRPQQIVSARFAPEPAWLKLHGCLLELGPVTDTPSFELVHLAEGVTICCEPSLRRIAVPLAGAIVEPMEVQADARLRFVQVPLKKPAPGLLQQQAPSQTSPPSAPQPPVAGPLLQQKPIVSEMAAAVLADFRSLLQVQGPLTVSVVRPDDLLVLKFEFRHMTLQVGPGRPPQLVRTPNAPRPIIIVHFPPQHVVEQAFRESESSSEPVTFPIGARIAGPSRLVFEVPDELPVIPYTLEALLDWSRFQQVVARAAEPPPPPPSLVLLPFRELSPFLKESIAPKVVPRGVPFQTEPKLFKPPGQMVLPESQSPGILQQLRPESQTLLTLPPAPPTKEELPNLTAIEAPYRLFMSPSRVAGWIHAQRPATLGGRTELWHTRLGVRRQDAQGRWWVDEADGWYRTLRAIWSPDYADDITPATPPKPDPFVTAPKPDPFLTALKALDRHQLVHLMADAKLDRTGWPLRVARADRFMLSSLGVWMQVRYAAERVAPIDLVGWNHTATMGRDQYVRVVRLGYLFPHGHKALLVTVTERKFEKVGGETVAVLRQRQFIEVREPLKSYPAPGQQSSPSQGRTFPFIRIRMLTLDTPNLDLPTPQPAMLTGLTPDQGFWPYVGGRPFLFHMIGEDHAGQSAEFSMPLVFLMASSAENPAIVQRVLDPDGPGPMKGYADDPQQRNVAGLMGQKVALAPSRPTGETILETADLAFGAEMPSPQTAAGLTNVQPSFYPSVERAGVRVPAVQHLLGTTTPTVVRYAAVFRALGFNPNGNAGEVFAELLAPLSLEFYSDKTGGLATPYLDIRGLSRRWGPVGGNLDAVAKGLFVPADYFRKAANPDDPAQRAKQANLLGSLYLGDVVASGPPPALKTRFLPPADRSRRRQKLLHLVSGPPGFQAEPRPPENPNRLWISFHFETEDLKPDPLKLFLPWLGDNPNAEGCCRAKLTLHSTLKVGLRRPGQPAGEAGFSARGVLGNFQLSLFSLVIVSFREIRFSVRSDNKPEVVVRLTDQDPVRFGGALKFVDELRKFLTAEIFDKIPNIAGTASSVGVKVERSLALPNVGIGMFSLSNLHFNFWLELPYVNQPIVFVFAFGSPNDPASLTVGPYGGGFCFVLGIGANGIQKIEAWFLFSGKAALDIGVASGGVCIECGIYFSIARNQAGQQEVKLGGLFRISGHMSVLGVVSVSVEFKLQLEYDASNNKLAGEASLVVKIELLLFTETVTLRVGKEFPGSTMTAMLPDDFVHLVSTGRPHLTQGTGGPVGRPRPPRLVDLLSESDWVKYGSAFAPAS